MILVWAIIAIIVLRFIWLVCWADGREERERKRLIRDRELCELERKWREEG